LRVQRHYSMYKHNTYNSPYLAVVQVYIMYYMHYYNIIRLSTCQTSLYSVCVLPMKTLANIT